MRLRSPNTSERPPGSGLYCSEMLFSSASVLAREHDDGDERSGEVVLDLLAGLEAVHLFHVHVHENQIRLFRLSPLYSFPSARCRRDFVSPRLE